MCIKPSLINPRNCCEIISKFTKCTIARAVPTLRRDQTMICDVNLGYSVRDKYGSGAPPLSPRPPEAPGSCKEEETSRSVFELLPSGLILHPAVSVNLPIQRTVLNEV